MFNQLRPSSFRGFAFSTPSDSTTYDRRIARHEYPQKDEPYHEEMGLSAAQIRIDAIIHGADYIERAAQFENILLKKGSGILIHPFYGEVELIITSHTRNNNYSELGHIVFTITAEKYGKSLYPRAINNSVAGIISSAENGFASLLSDFNNGFSLNGMPDFVANDALSRVNEFISSLNTVLNLNSTAFNSGLNLGNNITEVFKSIALSSVPIKIPAISGILQNNPVIDLIAMMNSLIGLSSKSVSDGSSTATTATQSRRIMNSNSLDLLMRGDALLTASRIAAYASYESRQDATRQRVKFSSAIDVLSREMADAGWDESWKAMEFVNAALVRDINERIGRLPYTLRVRPSSPRSSLVLSNFLYGNDAAAIIEKSEDIIKRNKIRNPAMMPAQSMEVLVDA